MTEYASHRRSGSLSVLTATLSNAPPSIVASINARRRAAGLVEIPTRGNPKAKWTPRRPTTTITMPRSRQSPASAAKWAGLRLSATVACGRLRQSLRT